MSILVNGMTMPTECRVCSFLEFYSHTGETWCKASDGILASGFKPIPYDGRPDWCPLVELPEKHGRLIDEDNVIDAIHERLQTLQTHKEFIKKRGDIDLLGVLPYISKIQTVIEAEGEE